MSTRSLTFLVVTFIAFNPSNAKQAQPFSDILKKINEWGGEAQSQILISGPMVVAGVLCFIASAISSAGGIGGGGLFIPILSIVAGLDMQTASSLSAFMVTGGSIANVMCSICIACPKLGGKSLIDYDIALSSEPCMLLGVSLGVICNLVFPDWFITVLFALFLAWCTSKTCRSGLQFWKNESEEIRRNGLEQLEKGQLVENDGPNSIEVPLLVPQENTKLRIPWFKLAVLLLIWFSFFSVYLLRGNTYTEGIISLEPCGVGYWILSSAQVPLAMVFTTWIVFSKERIRDLTLIPEVSSLTRNKFVFPLMALIAGILGGLFGIGGGMLISPLLLQVGITPEVTAATCSFMVLFSTTMSALQFMMLGMEHVQVALILAIMCFVASLLGLLVVQRAIRKYGRASIIVFSISIVMCISNVLMTSFGAIKVWTDYESGQYMGFKLPC
ncbi:hypothetical protein VNO78_03674 [Psophocarpus tetragonolobus]|uniref:Sulfite exporter TauE/SafE family protein n=1 Tax=Psophocarpus tetragonolobus TaxID=3891 RepID=A0AAN9T3I3_PSOTE